MVTLSKLFCLFSEKGSTLKGKNLLPMGVNYFLLEWTPFQKGYKNAKRKPQKLNLVKNDRKATKCVQLPL